MAHHPHDIANLPHYLAVMTAKGVPHGWVREPTNNTNQNDPQEWLSRGLATQSEADREDLNALLGACVVRLGRLGIWVAPERNKTSRICQDPDDRFGVPKLPPGDWRIGHPTPLAACIAALEQLKENKQ